MLWYLLYPLRGTTQPPRLTATHPIRRAFYRHGKTTAHHWLIAMLVSVAIAVGFSFPSIFLSDNPTAGFAAYPHHVWTTAKPFDGDQKLIDVEMRQIWIHGSYMNALDKDVLKRGLSIQEALVGGEHLTSVFPSLDDTLRSSTLSWGFHSPLMYWNNSAEQIDADPDILQTINDQSHTSSLLNVALRPASVFAGKIFDRRKLTAADALVITLMNKVEDGAGGRWTSEMKSLAQSACEGCTLFPQNGHVTRHGVYQFSFIPLSLRENVALTFAYSCMALYVLLSLRRLKAFHSQFGLVVTAVTQMTCSILASFTICGILKINLSMIPQNAYPFVVLVIGLENMFRLINAVLAYPPTMATDQRIANALGDVGPVSVATAGQNLIMLSLLTAFVSPGVAAFCAFACIATLFDVFFLLTFFVAVLNVDIRRFELQDALARSTHTHVQQTALLKRRQQHASPSRHATSKHTWFDALVQGRLPFSTRMAGTAVTSTFILSLNYHFFDHHTLSDTTTLRHLLGIARSGSSTPNIADFDTFTPPPMNATLTPGEWMRMQDFDTAREVMRLAKPGADSFVIRVFAPLVVVLSGADRTGATHGVEERWTQALTGFARYHFYPVAVAIVFAVAFVAVLMNFLLYSEGEEGDSRGDGATEGTEEGVRVRSVTLPHRLDVVKLIGTTKGHFVSIGLDRSVAVSILDRTQQSYRTIALTGNALLSLQWPVRNAALDDDAEWLALHCADDRIVVNYLAMPSFVRILRYPDDNPPLLFTFMRIPYSDAVKTCLVVLTSGGSLLCEQMDAPAESSRIHRLSKTPLLGAVLVGKKIVVVTESGLVVAYSMTEKGTWEECGSQSLPLEALQGKLTGAVGMTVGTDLGPETLIVTTNLAVFFLDSQTLAVLGKVETPQGLADCSLVMGEAADCAACGSLALKSVGFCGRDELRPGRCNIMTLAPAEGGNNSAICFRNTMPACSSFDNTSRTKHEMPDAGAWQGLGSQTVLGLRKKPKEEITEVPLAEKSATSTQSRHRRKDTRRSSDSEDIWEAYTFTLDGEVETADASTPYANSDAEDINALYVNDAGPTASLDNQSIAVAFGNHVKVIRASRRGVLTKRDSGSLMDRISSTSKRRLTLRKAL